MATHDDPHLELLEQDLNRLAGPRQDDERLRLALRRQLADRVAPRRYRARSTRIAVGVAAVTAAAAAIAAVAIVGTSGSGGPANADAAVIHLALSAVTPPANAILHEKVVGVQNGVRVEAESWQETSWPYASRGIKGPVGRQGESGDDGKTSFDYDPRTNTISERPDSSPPTFVDPMSQVRQELAAGEAQLAGTVLIGGTPLYEIHMPHGLVGYFDTRDHRPRYLDDAQRDGSVIRLRVAAYQYLPMTASNRALLSVAAQHPNARVVTTAGGAGTK
jgi:hypothetical protein